MTFEKELDKAIGRVAFKVAADIKKNAPVDTGEFRNSIVVQKENGQWIVGSSDPKAEMIELGTRPHVIEPKNKKALFWPGAAHPVKRVLHPGTIGRNLFLNASIKAKDYFRKELKNIN